MWEFTGERAAVHAALARPENQSAHYLSLPAQNIFFKACCNGQIKCTLTPAWRRGGPTLGRSGISVGLSYCSNILNFFITFFCLHNLLPYLVPTKNVPSTHCSKFGCFNFINLRFKLCFVYFMQNLFQLLSFVQC